MRLQKVSTFLSKTPFQACLPSPWGLLADGGGLGRRPGSSGPGHVAGALSLAFLFWESRRVGTIGRRRARERTMTDLVWAARGSHVPFPGP